MDLRNLVNVSHSFLNEKLQTTDRITWDSGYFNMKKLDICQILQD